MIRDWLLVVMMFASLKRSWIWSSFERQ